MEEGIQNDQEPLVFSDCFCPLCSSKRTSFTCEKCIKLGLFYNSRKRSEESYEEKRQRLETIKKLKLKYAERVLEFIANTKSTEELRYNIQQYRNKVSTLTKTVTFLKQKETKDQAILTKTIDENKKRRSHLEKLKERIKQQEKESKNQNSLIHKKQSALQVQLENLSKIRRIRIDQIQKYLFPISKQKVFPEFGTPPDDTIMKGAVSDVVIEARAVSCEVALTEATRTSYIEGRWVNDDHLGNVQYKILETFLPADGNYSAYGQLLKANKNGSSESVPTCNLKNSVFTLTAGLTYTCQLLDLIAYFLDITLPRNLNYSEFCLNELSASEFRSAVSRLNANVMYLCLSQNMGSPDVHPKRTLQNIYTCLQSSNVYLGRHGPHNVVDQFESQANDSYEDESSTSEDESDIDSDVDFSSSDNEWENINDVQVVPVPLSDDVIPAVSTQTMTSPTSHQPRQSTTSSLVSSVTSLWPWKS